MAKQTYTVRTALIHERRIYQPGDSVTINDDKLASALVKRGQIATARSAGLGIPGETTGSAEEDRHRIRNSLIH